MVRLPQNIIAAMAIQTPGIRTATKKELCNALINSGYGQTKARKWIETFIETGALQLVGEDPIYGLELYSAKWWTPNGLITRVKSPRIESAPLTDAEMMIIKAVAE